MQTDSVPVMSLWLQVNYRYWQMLVSRLGPLLFCFFFFVVFIGCECRMRFVLVILLCKRIWRYFWTNVQLGTKIFGLTSWVLNNLNRPQRAVSIANTMSIVELILDILSPVIRQFSV